MLQIAKDAGEYAQLTALLLKYGKAEIASAVGLTPEKSAGQSDGELSSPESLAADIEALGPAYIKLAQIASTRFDLVPHEYAVALSRLQDDVAPLAYDVICDQIEEELGATPDRIFATFDKTPLASASIGQVHRATLRDGRDVVVKVQRPGVEELAVSQLQSLRRLAVLVDRNTDLGARVRFRTLVDAVEYAFSVEFDYRREAANLERLAEHLSSFQCIDVPRPIPSYVSRRVLVMERVKGRSLDRVSGVVLNEIDTERLAKQLIECYLKQVLIDGFFHADPHPGNLLFTEDHKIALIDGGMVISVAPQMRRKLGLMMMAIGNHEGEEAARIAANIGFQEDSFEIGKFVPAAARVIAQPGDTEREGMSIGKVILQLLTVSGEQGLVLPFELILFSKAVLQLETTLEQLAPDLRIRETVRDNSVRLLSDRAAEYLNPGRMVRTALEGAELAAEMPQRLNQISDLVASNGIKVKVDAFDEDRMVHSVRKIANRITAGLVTSALLLSASLLMRLESGWQALGYPVLPTFFFLLAASIGMYLVWLALVKDA